MKPYHEIVGTLQNKAIKNNQLELILNINKVLEIPPDSFEEDLLQVLVGKKIGILNNDGDYKIRIIKE